MFVTSVDHVLFVAHVDLAWLTAASALAGVASYSFRPARTRAGWWVALFATELGHVWLLPATVTCLLATTRGIRHDSPVAGCAGALAGLAMLGFARPTWSAWRTSRRLATELPAAFGGFAPSLWSWRRLWRWPSSTPKGPHQTHRTPSGDLDFYPASETSTTPAPCIVLVHGGGWDSGDRTQFASLNHWLAKRGVAVAAISYRLAPAHRWPAQRDDLLSALVWLRTQAARLGIDPDRLVLAGRSAGGQIATATAYGARPAGVCAVAAFYACHDLDYVWSIRSPKGPLDSDLLMRQFLGGGPEGREELYQSGSGEKLVHPDAPPTLLLHGALDELVWCRHSERLAATLSAAGVPHVFARLPWATHAADANLHGPAGQLASGALLHLALNARPLARQTR